MHLICSKKIPCNTGKVREALIKCILEKAPQLVRGSKGLSGKTPLHSLLENGGEISALKLLLKADAPINAAQLPPADYPGDYDGPSKWVTPFLSAMASHPEAIPVLAGYGADMSVENRAYISLLLNREDGKAQARQALLSSLRRRQGPSFPDFGKIIDEASQSLSSLNFEILL